VSPTTLSAREFAQEFLGIDQPRQTYRLLEADPDLARCAYRPFGKAGGTIRLIRKDVEAWARRKARAAQRG